VGGYAIWLLYGLSVGDIPLIVVDVFGLLCGGLTLAVALSLRGSLLRPASWASCARGMYVAIRVRGGAASAAGASWAGLLCFATRGRSANSMVTE